MPADLLKQKNSYFRNLSSEGQERFLKRLEHFIRTKQFIGRDGLFVNHEMKSQIGACAVQLTFGLTDYDFSHFHSIWLYPSTFYSKNRNVHFKGMTSPNGIIALSWKDFQQGYSIADDNYNLGLHELAHALKLDVTEGDSFDERFASYLDNWLEVGSVEFERIRTKQTSFLRAYGGTNMHEFFAVCVEHFFESPEAFSKALPEVYDHLCFLLNQDPRQTKNDFALPADFMQRNPLRKTPIPEKLKKSYKYSSWHWSLTLAILGLVLCPGLYIYVMSFTVLLWGDVFSAIFIAGTLGLTLWPYFKSRRILNFLPFVGVSFAGIGNCFVLILLALNFLIPISEDKMEEYKIEDRTIVYTSLWDRNIGGRREKIKTGVVLRLENDAYSEYRHIRQFDYEMYHVQIQRYGKVKLHFRTGLLGIKVLKDFEFSPEPKPVDL